MLESLTLQAFPNAPCIFHGKLSPNDPPIYVGIYVDDFVYFSSSPDVKSRFESQLSALTDVDFLGTVKHFLGIRFDWTSTDKSLETHDNG